MKEIIKGADVPNIAPSTDEKKIVFSNEILKLYIPAWEKCEGGQGLKYLALIMTQMEGFEKGSRSFRTNNPGNVGNTDNGTNKGFSTLQAGIQAQIDYLARVTNGQHKAYPLGKTKIINPYYSPEIARNAIKYQMSPWCYGYKFTYTGELRQFIKIYSTGARQKNTYLSVIRSYFKNLGFNINDTTTLLEIQHLGE